MTDTKTVLERLDRAIALADKSNKINRNQVIGRVICDNIELIRKLLIGDNETKEIDKND